LTKGILQHKGPAISLACAWCGERFIPSARQASPGRRKRACCSHDCARARQGAAKTAKALGRFSANFWRRVKKTFPNKCWPWTGCRNEDGYGRGVYVPGTGKRPTAHRVAFWLAYGYWPMPMGIHTCDNPWCCNPTHVIPGTTQENTADRHQKGRDATGDRNGARTRPDRLARGTRNGKSTKPERTPRGEQNSQSKLTDEQVRALRAAYASGVRGALGLTARSFGVSYHTAWDAASGRHWRHIS